MTLDAVVMVKERIALLHHRYCDVRLELGIDRRSMTTGYEHRSGGYSHEKQTRVFCHVIRVAREMRIGDKCHAQHETPLEQ